MNAGKDVEVIDIDDIIEEDEFIFTPTQVGIKLGLKTHQVRDWTEALKEFVDYEKDPNNGYMKFSKKSIEQLQTIKTLREEFGANHAKVKSILKSKLNEDALKPDALATIVNTEIVSPEDNPMINFMIEQNKLMFNEMKQDIINYIDNNNKSFVETVRTTMTEMIRTELENNSNVIIESLEAKNNQIKDEVEKAKNETVDALTNTLKTRMERRQEEAEKEKELLRSMSFVNKLKYGFKKSRE